MNTVSMSNRLFKNSIFALVAIPIANLDSWKMEAYSKIPANKVFVADQKLHIQIRKSASPLIYPLQKNAKVIGFRIKGEFSSLPKFSDVTRQGQKGHDDFPLRIGFIIPGEKKLSGVKRIFTPDWVKNLYRQLPEDHGLDHISFFNVTQNSQLVGTSRKHPSTDLITEDFIELVEVPGPFDIKYTLKEPVEVAAVWLSIDGDDSKSDFDLMISKLELQTE